MATVYRAPIDPPAFSIDSWREDEDRYIADLKALATETDQNRAQAQGKRPGNLVGEIVSFPIADGAAQYMVWQHSPFSLVHIATGDAWSIPEAHARGLRLKDVRDKIGQAERIRQLFSEKA